MKSIFSTHFALNTFAGAALLVILGCGSSTPSRFYALSPVKDVTGNAQNGLSLTTFAIGIRTLKLPEYLLRQQIIKRRANELVIAEFDRWAEPLEANFKRVLIEDLSNAVPTNNIFLFPARDSLLVNYQLLLEVTEFEFTQDKHVTLSARWGLEKGESIAFLMDKHSSFSEPSGENFAEIVSTMSRLVGKLSGEIASEIRRRVNLGR